MTQKTLFIQEMMWVALGGMTGALLRNVTNRLLPHADEGAILLTATAVENIAGSFLIGLIFFLLIERAEKSRNLSLFLLTGIIGSYTTYSGFMLEAFIYSGESISIMLLYLFSQIFTGVIAVFAGAFCAKEIELKVKS